MSQRQFISAPLLAGLLAVTIALSFALYTQHAWEDYYITYRSSKNLATGQGLVFNAGERLHTFTSPLGVLLPAVASLLTANSSDPAALWIFRLMCIAAFGGAAALLVSVGLRLRHAGAALCLPVAWLITDAKCVDFTINGMETAFMLLFLTYAFWAHVRSDEKSWRHLGVAWAGLMWTRPDSFIYIGLIATGFLLFPQIGLGALTRRQLFVCYLRAGLLTTALYLPWLVLAHLYYGTAVPHTITAKGSLSGPHTISGLLRQALMLPFTAGAEKNALGHTFLPAYFMMGGWPGWLIQGSRAVGVLCSVLWLLPRQTPLTRTASFAYFGAHAYLAHFPYFPFPWYLPSTALLAFLALGGLAQQILTAAARPRLGWLRPVTFLLGAGLVAVAGWTSVQAARQLRAQQAYIEEGTRRAIGEWLHVHAQPGDTVFMEPLGYIGFYSGLKTYDFPGMSSREMVQARAKVGNSWARLIEYLHPHWLVLRPHEVARIAGERPDLIPIEYSLVREFSLAQQIDQLSVYGREYLHHDAIFNIYKIGTMLHHSPIDMERFSQFSVSQEIVDNFSVTLVHAPGYMTLTVPAEARFLDIRYGFTPGAYTGDADLTDGAVFEIEWQGDGQKTLLLKTYLNPVAKPEHRGLQHFNGALPVSTDGQARLIFRTIPGHTTMRDWTCWSTPRLYSER